MQFQNADGEKLRPSRGHGPAAAGREFTAVAALVRAPIRWYDSPAFKPERGVQRMSSVTLSATPKGQWLPGNHHLREWCRDQFSRVLPNESRSHFGGGHEAARHARAPRSVRCCRRGHLMLPSRAHLNAGYGLAKGAEQKERRKPMPGLPPPGSFRIHR